MKVFHRVIASFLTMVMLVALVGCNDKGPIEVPSLTLSESSVAFASEGGEKFIKVRPFPEGLAWKVVENVSYDWFAIYELTDGVTVIAEPNYSSEVRKGSIELVSPSDEFNPYKLVVVQEAAAELEFSTSLPSSYLFDSEGETVSFATYSSLPVEISGATEWLKVEYDEEARELTFTALQNAGAERRSCEVTISSGAGEQLQVVEIAVEQMTRAENSYLNLVGRWEICANKWYYTTNGSLNELTYSPNQTDYCLVFDIVEGKYGETLIMKNFLYPGTSLEVRYDKDSRGFVVPFGWTVLSYDVFFYITIISGRQFSYASYEVPVVPTQNNGALRFDMPTVSGSNYVGFGLWTYNDNGDKIAFGYSSHPTMYPMGEITLVKRSN